MSDDGETVVNWKMILLLLLLLGVVVLVVGHFVVSLRSFDDQ